MNGLRVLPAAEAEVLAAAEWYETQREGLGVEFVAEADAALERIAASPGSFPPWRGDRDYRKAPLARFPYLVFFRTIDDMLEVVAVAHMRRRPGYWADR